MARRRRMARPALLLGVAVLAGCGGPQVRTAGDWQEGAPRGQAFSRVLVVGISPDSAGDQARFDAKHSLAFPLLSDTGHAACGAWGAWDGERVIRSSFLVGADGRLLGAWYRVKPEETVPKAREALAGG